MLMPCRTRMYQYANSFNIISNIGVPSHYEYSCLLSHQSPAYPYISQHEDISNNIPYIIQCESVIAALQGNYKNNRPNWESENPMISPLGIAVKWALSTDEPKTLLSHFREKCVLDLLIDYKDDKSLMDQDVKKIVTRLINYSHDSGFNNEDELDEFVNNEITKLTLVIDKVLKHQNNRAPLLRPPLPL